MVTHNQLSCMKSKIGSGMTFVAIHLQCNPHNSNFELSEIRIITAQDMVKAFELSENS